MVRLADPMPHGDVERKRFQFNSTDCECSHFPVQHTDGCKLCGCLAGWQRVTSKNRKPKTVTYLPPEDLCGKVDETDTQ